MHTMLPEPCRVEASAPVPRNGQLRQKSNVAIILILSGF